MSEATTETTVATDGATVVAAADKKKPGRVPAVLPRAAARYETAQRRLAALLKKKQAQTDLDDEITAAQAEVADARDGLQAALAAVEGA